MALLTISSAHLYTCSIEMVYTGRDSAYGQGDSAWVDNGLVRLVACVFARWRPQRWGTTEACWGMQHLRFGDVDWKALGGQSMAVPFGLTRAQDRIEGRAQDGGGALQSEGEDCEFWLELEDWTGGGLRRRCCWYGSE